MKKLFFTLLISGAFSGGALLAEDPVDFEKQIYPLLKQSCVKCHSQPYEETRGTRTRTKKPKGGIIFSNKADILAAVNDDEKKILVPGKPEESRMLLVSQLPLEHDEHQPAPGKAPQWTKADEALISKWIKEGAKFGTWTEDKKDREGLEWDGKEKTEELQKAVDAQ